MTHTQRPAQALSLQLCQDMEAELAAMRTETDPIKLRLSAEKARCWQSMALAISRLAPLTDDPPTPSAPQPDDGPSEAEMEARMTALVDELDSRKPEITALMTLKAAEAQAPQNRHARRAMEARAGRG